MSEQDAAIAELQARVSRLAADVDKLSRKNRALERRIDAREKRGPTGSLSLVEIDAASIIEGAYRSKSLGNYIFNFDFPQPGGLIADTIKVLKDQNRVIGNPRQLFVRIRGDLFPEGHPDVEYQDTVRGSDVFINPTSRMPHRAVFTRDGIFDEATYRLAIIATTQLQETLLEDLAAAARENGAKSVNVIVAYLPRARDDRLGSRRKSIGIKELFKKWNRLFSTVVVVHPHSEQSLNASNSLLFQVAAHEIVAPIFLQKHSGALNSIDDINRLFSEHSFAAPDTGAAATVRRSAKAVADLAAHIYCERLSEQEGRQITLPERKGIRKQILSPELIIINKKRSGVGENEVTEVIGDPNGKRILLIDDIIDSGGTTIKAADALLDRGAIEISAYGTHGVLTQEAVKKLMESPIKSVTTTNTLAPNDMVLACPKIETVSIASLIANIIPKAVALAPANIRLQDPGRSLKTIRKLPEGAATRPRQGSRSTGLPENMMIMVRQLGLLPELHP